MKLFLQKKIAFYLLALLSITTSNLFAQRICATMQAIQQRMQTDSNYRKDYEAKQNNLSAYLALHPIPESFASGDTITIPVVVHIVLPNPTIVTDANVQYFIDRLNTDYSGMNDDSANATSFYGVRGHSLIRFAIARRDINGNATTGVERKVGTGNFTGNANDPIKTSVLGLAPWDITKYYNLWVGVGSGGTLGVAPEIGPGTQNGANIDGICCDYTVFANNTCFSLSSYAMARTSVHEIGHNMGLNHTFQCSSCGSGVGCTSSDFSDNLSSPGMALPASLLGGIDDTPPTKAINYGCPAVGTVNGCSPSVPKMFQNYMDYSDDACLTLFTNGQVARMHYVIETFRPGYLTTKGHLPPDGTPQDDAAAYDIVSPGGKEVIGCTAKSYAKPVCTGTLGAFTPKLRITSLGVNNLTAVKVGLMLNGVVVANQTFTTSLGAGKSTVFSLPNQTLVYGNNVLKFFTSNPNGVADGNVNNDTITSVVLFNNHTPTIATTIPTLESFEAEGINPTANNFSLVNSIPNLNIWAGSNTWKRTTTAAKTGNACAKIQLYGNTAIGDVNTIQSPYLNFNNTVDTPYLTFNYAYRLKSTATASRKDTLSVEISTDCAAANWTSLWKKGGVTLQSNLTVIATDWTATATDWTTTPIKINLWAYRNTPCYIAFKAKNGNGQNIYLDDINITTVAALPLKLISFNVQQNAKNIACKWETKQEENVKNFNVERSLNGVDFENIGTVNAVGNTTNTAFYQYADDNAYKLNVTTLYYRLKMNDVNGKFNYSKIISVKLGEKQSLQLYPNPAKDLVNLQITHSSIIANNTTVQIVDYLGRVLLEKKITTTIGTQAIEFNTTSLPKGNYVMVVKSESEIKTLKFVKD